MGKAVKLSTTSFRNTPLAELCMEDALKMGAAKLGNLKPEEIKETSIRFCVDGLRDWLMTYVDDYCDGSFSGVISALSWHWASFCETNDMLLKVRADFSELRHEIAEGTGYVDLMDRLKQSPRIKEFGYTHRPIHVRVPVRVVNTVGHMSSALGLNFSKLFQVGLGWSLSTNRDGLYAAWLAEVFDPLFRSLMAHAEWKVGDMEEVRAVLAHRREKKQ